MEQQEKFESWAILEMMGHRKLAGKVSEQIIAGVPLLRIDVPEIPGANGGATIPAYTQFYGASSIYSLTPCSETVARCCAMQRREEPIHRWELPQLEKPRTVDAEDEDIEDR